MSQSKQLIARLALPEIKVMLQYFKYFYDRYAEKHSGQLDFPGLDLQKDCIKFLVEHLCSHIKEYSIHQEQVDLFKLVSWAGMYFHQSLKTQQKNFPVGVVVNVLNYMLRQDSKSLSKEVLKKIGHMAGNDNVKDDFAIGKNGLYMIFRACYKLEGLAGP